MWEWAKENDETRADASVTGMRVGHSAISIIYQIWKIFLALRRPILAQ